MENEIFNTAESIKQERQSLLDRLYRVERLLKADKNDVSFSIELVRPKRTSFKYFIDNELFIKNILENERVELTYKIKELKRQFDQI